MKYHIWGVPCSGTTIICRFLHSLPSSAFLCEPHLELVKTGRIKYPRVKTSNHYVVDEVLERLIDNGHSHVGFKEVLRAKKAYPSYFPNEHFLRHYKDRADYRAIYVIRCPVSAWGSLRSKYWGAEWASLAGYIENYRAFLSLLDGHSRVVVYERFTTDPCVEISRATALHVSEPVPLKALRFRFGNTRARNATSIMSGVRRHVPRSQLRAIESEGLVQQYNEIASR